MWARALCALVGLLWAGGVAAQRTLPFDDPPELRALVEEALSRHPAVAAVRATVAAARQTPSRAGSLPDPTLFGGIQNLRVDDPGLDTSPMTMIVVGLGQGFPFPGKLGHREDTAEAAARAAEKNVAVVRTQVAERVRRLYWRLHFAERAQELTAENERVINTLANVVHERLAVGQAAQQDALQSQVVHSSLRAQLVERAEAVTSARRALSAAVGRAPGAELAATKDPETAAMSLDRKILLEQARRNNAALASSEARAAVARRGLAEAEYERWPDFQLNLMYGIRTAVPGDMSKGADVIGATLGVTLPVWMGGKQNARVREQAALLDAASAMTHDIGLQVETALARAIDAVERLDAEIDLYAREIVPEADGAFDASITDYQFTRVQFVSVLSNWRAVLDAQLTYERLLSERAERVAEIRALVAAEAEGKTP